MIYCVKHLGEVKVNYVRLDVFIQVIWVGSFRQALLSLSCEWVLFPRISTL